MDDFNIHLGPDFRFIHLKQLMYSRFVTVDPRLFPFLLDLVF